MKRLCPCLSHPLVSPLQLERGLGNRQTRDADWHRKGFKLFWKWKSQAGRPRIPENVRKLIVQMAQENPTWGQAPREGREELRGHRALIASPQFLIRGGKPLLFACGETNGL